MKKYGWQNELGNDYEKCDIDEEWGPYDHTSAVDTAPPSSAEPQSLAPIQPGGRAACTDFALEAAAAEGMDDLAQPRSDVRVWNAGPTSVAVNPHLLRSAVFGHRSIVLDDDREVATVERPALLACGYVNRLTFIGPRWGQDHATVFFHLLLAMRWMRIGERLEIYPRRFAHRDLGWSYSAYSHKKLIRALQDLSEGAIARRWQGPCSGESAVQILQEPEIVGNKVRVALHASYSDTMFDVPTYLSLPRRRALKVGIETWLYQYVRASLCDREVSLSRLRELFASSKSLSEFGRDVRAALKKLEEFGLVEGFNAERGRIRIMKKVGTRT